MKVLAMRRFTQIFVLSAMPVPITNFCGGDNRKDRITMNNAVCISLLAVLGAGLNATAACPPPSVAQGSQCVLTQDATLTDTMWITSGQTLDCQGHQLTPTAIGVNDDPTTPAAVPANPQYDGQYVGTNEFKPSQPELAIFVHGASNVTIKNCTISGFDFGIIVAQSKNVNISPPPPPPPPPLGTLPSPPSLPGPPLNSP